MSRYLYLVRHGKPKMCGEGSYCIGRRTDVPLSEEGRAQARALIPCFEGLEGIYSSTLLRSAQTAKIISEGRNIVIEPQIDEMDVGEWEGKNFSEIRSAYPAVYTARKEDWAIPPDGGEKLESVAERMHAALMRIAANEKDNAVIVTHDGAIRALLQQLMNLDTRREAMIRQPYGSITVLGCDGKSLTALATGKLPADAPADDEIKEFWKLCNTPEGVREHSRAVCAECLTICEQLNAAGVALSKNQLRAAAMLHDACRLEGSGHAGIAAKMLAERGYLRVAQMVLRHHDVSFQKPLDETQVLYLADKLIDGTKRVGIAERFAASKKKCSTEEAVCMHAARLEAAEKIQMKIETAVKTGE